MGRVMIVDDNQHYLELMGAVLIGRGHTVISLSQAAGAATAVASSKPDLLILDLQLGEISGYDLLDQIREEKATRRLPVLICTANNDEYSKSRSNLADRGCLRVLSKPFDLTAFLSTVSEMLDFGEERKEKEPRATI